MRPATASPGPRLFLAVAVVCLAVPFFALKYALAGPSINAVWLMLSALAESLLFLLPLPWLRGRRRYTVLLPLLLLPAYLYVSLLYFRNFDDMLSPSLHWPGAINAFAVESGLASVRLSDIFILVAFLIPPAMLAVWHRSIISRPFGRRFRIAYLLIAITAAAAEFTLQARRYVVIRRELPDDVPTALREYPRAWCEPAELMSTYMMRYGLAAYWVKMACIAYESRTLRLTPERSAAVRSVLAPPAAPLPPGLADTLAANRNRSMIVIVVESLTSEVFRLPYINNVAPCLSALAADPASIVAADLTVLADKGRSADGQLMLNTGLLPLASEPFTISYSKADYPSLAKALRGHYAAEIIAEQQSIWNHGETSQSYGYRTLISDVSRSGFNQDSIVFARAAALVSSLPRPFLLQVSTISMHDPYARKRVAPIPRAVSAIPAGVDSRDREYLLRLAHFDSALAHFISELRADGPAGSAVIVITGDHEPNREAVSPMFHSLRVPLVISGAGVGRRIDRPASQLDIFPTLLDVMGVDSYVPLRIGRQYRGMGASLLRAERPAADTAAMRRGAALVFRTRYFGR